MAKDGDIVVPVLNKAQEALSVMLDYYKLLQKERNAFSNHLEALAEKYFLFQIEYIKYTKTFNEL